MTGGSQKFIARNRAPRVQIEYDVELYGSEKKVQLPFVMGVMSDLAGKSRIAQPAIEDRGFLDIDVDNFDDRMKAMQPRAAFSVPNTLTGEGSLSVDLTFESMEDFTPAAIAAKIAPLRDLLEARTQLTTLATYMDGKAGAEALIERVLTDPTLLQALARRETASDTAAALESLRMADVPAASREDESEGILGALKAHAPTEDGAGDETANILADLSKASEPSEPEDRSDSILDQMRRTPDAPEGEAADGSDAVLADLRRAPSADTPETVSKVEEALSSLTAPPEPDADKMADIADVLASVPEVTEPHLEDKTGDDVLAGLADAASRSEPDAGSERQSVLDTLPEVAPVDDESPEIDAVLGDLQAPGDDPTEDQAGVDSVLASIEPASPDPSDPAENIDLILDDLALDDAETAPATSSVEADLAPALSTKEPDLPSEARPALADSPAPGSETFDDADLDDLDDLLGDTPGPAEAASQPDTADAPAMDDLDDLDDLLGDTPGPAEAASQPDAADAPAMDDLDDLDDLLGDTPGPTEAAVPAQPAFTFGSLTAERPAPQALTRKRFRIAIFGDFSGRAARGAVATGDALAARAPVLLDPDTVEDVIEGFATRLVLPIGKDGKGVEVRLNGLDDLHPDELFDTVELFSELAALRGRLATGATADSAINALRAWGAAHDTPVAPPRRRSSGSAVPAHLKLTDFQRLIGDTEPRSTEPAALDELLARIVGPHVRAAPDADTVAMQAAVDDALSTAMRMVLHHPEFQSVEAQWRAIDLIARSIETDDTLEVMLHDVSAEEIAADLASAPDLAQSGFARLLTEAPMDAETGRGGYSALIGLYTFEETPPHADLLGRIARVAAHVDAPFLAALSPAFLNTPKEDRHPLVAEAWDSLRAMPEAGHLGLAAPRFLLRRPYGAKSDPISSFKFEEFSMAEGLSGLLWCNPVVLVAILLAKSYRENGTSLGLGSVMSLGQMPYHVVTDRHGDQVALPCTERNLTLDTVEKVMTRGVMPVVSVKGRDEVRLASFQSLAGGDILGPWSGVAPPPPSPPRPAPVASEADDLGLDDLLAGFDDAADETVAAADEIDADLAALLEDL